LANYSIHKSPQVRAKEREGQSVTLYLFFLPLDSPELNLIEGEWHQIKTHEISGRMDVYHNEPLSQRAIVNRFCGASELRTKIALHSIVRPKILLLELSDAESN